MRPVTEAEKATINQIAKTTAPQRQAITLYQAEDKSLALFRMQAGNAVREITIRHVTGQALTKECRGFLDAWMSNAPGGVGDLVREFVRALESATGREIKHTKTKPLAA